MEQRQSLVQQVLFGALFGVLFSLINWMRDPNPEPLLSTYSIGMLIGGAVGGVFLYMLLYRFWPRKK